MISKKIILCEYNPYWKIQFESLEFTLFNYLKSDILKIEHVGSTSIVGLIAKPIIDLDLVIEQNDTIKKKVIQKLEKLGYIHSGNLGITGREAFKRTDDYTPQFELTKKKKWFEHHLYLCEINSIGYLNHINFKNYLKSHPSKIKEYASLKRELASKYSFNMDAYVDGKTKFITDILKKAGMDQNEINLIEKENKIN